MPASATAAAALQILNNALGLSKSVRERLQSSKDSGLRELILNLYDTVLSLKESALRFGRMAGPRPRIGCIWNQRNRSVLSFIEAVHRGQLQ
jgi:hypothetical protein